MHWLIFLCKVIIGQMPTYLSMLPTPHNNGHYHLRSQNRILFKVPKTKKVLGIFYYYFSYAAPFILNTLQTDLKLDYFVDVDHFKSMILDLLKTECKCF